MIGVFARSGASGVVPLLAAAAVALLAGCGSDSDNRVSVDERGEPPRIPLHLPGCR